MWNLESDLAKAKQELGSIAQRNRHMSGEVQKLQEERNELDARTKKGAAEIEALRDAENGLLRHCRELETELANSQQEVEGCREELAIASQRVQDLEVSHQTTIKELNEVFTREKNLAKAEHEREILVEKEKFKKHEKLAASLSNSTYEQTQQHIDALEKNTHKLLDDLSLVRKERQQERDQADEQIREAKINLSVKDARIRKLDEESEAAHNKIQRITSELDQRKEAQQALELSKQAAVAQSRDFRQALEEAQLEIQRMTSEQIAKLGKELHNIKKDNAALESDLKDAREALDTGLREASVAGEESAEKKQRLLALHNRLEQKQKQVEQARIQIKQKDAELDKLRFTLRQERGKRDEQATGARESTKRIVDLTAQLAVKTKQLKEAEASHNARFTEQNKSLSQKSKTIRTLETELAESQQAQRQLQVTMEKALLKEEQRRNLIFSEFQKLRKEVRVMCRIRPSNPQDGPLLAYETTQGKFHNKPAGLEIISKKGQYGTKTQVDDRTKHYSFDRVFEPHETNADVWLELSQFVQSFVDGRQVTILCYGQTATGKTYTMSNSTNEVDDHGEAVLADEGIIPRAKTLIFDEANKRREKGWTVSVRGCCYEVYLKEIRLLLPQHVVKKKSLDATSPPWWHVRDAEYKTLASVEDFDYMFESAMESRMSAATMSNTNSSRSHFVLHLEFETKSPTMRTATRGSLSLVDLAGSEDPIKSSNVGRSAAGTPSSGRMSSAEDAEWQRIRDQRQREGIAINQSLRVMRKSIARIRNPTGANGKPTLEGGDEESSTLAKLLGPCLGRDSMVLMLVMINLGIESLAETKATLESGKEVSFSSSRRDVVIPSP
ncbi:P-loop containing nucleoside triphosphate hydrolase protein [Astrocystis sublimbata]|nr:P-loop containing nucleoside triphosphate hydrolase protein [Astrocystis sublimbata]